jgi:uncharacterized glyoxalase superfamily protein PhnB
MVFAAFLRRSTAMAKKSAGTRGAGKSTTSSKRTAGAAARSRPSRDKKDAPASKKGGAARGRSGAAPARAKNAKAQAKAKPAPRPKRLAAPDEPKRSISGNDVRRLLPRNQPETLRCTSLTVSLTADDLEKSRAFYVDGLRFHVKDRWEQNGKLLGLELVAGSCLIGLSQDDWSKGRNRSKGIGMRIYLTTALDLDRLADGFRERGVAVEMTAEWGPRMLHVTDPDGFKITIYNEPTE